MLHIGGRVDFDFDPADNNATGEYWVQVYVQLGDGSPTQVLNKHVDANSIFNGTWSYSVSLEVEGALTITASAEAKYTVILQEDAEGNPTEIGFQEVTADDQQVEVTIRFPDNVSPSVSITAPPDHVTKLGGEEGALIPISGTATDVGTGVGQVWWSLGASEGVAEPLAAGDWSTWNAEVPVPPRQQIVQELDSSVSADRPSSLRQQFPDQWYDLHNPDLTPTPMTVHFDTTREDFPPNVDDLKIEHIVLYIVRSDGQPFDPPLTVKLYFTPQDGVKDGGEATSEDGVFSTRRGNAAAWTTITDSNLKPFGEWELSLKADDPVKDKEIRDRFKNEEIEDILFVITYSGRTPEWPT